MISTFFFFEAYRCILSPGQGIVVRNRLISLLEGLTPTYLVRQSTDTFWCYGAIFPSLCTEKSGCQVKAWCSGELDSFSHRTHAAPLGGTTPVFMTSRVITRVHRRFSSMQFDTALLLPRSGGHFHASVREEG